jgi:hypothetical protein
MRPLSSVADRVIDAWKSFWSIERQRRQLAEEMASLGRDEAGRILRDIGLPESSLPVVVRRGARSRALLEGMYARLSITGEALQRDRAVTRDIERQCLICAAQRQCRRWLARGGDPEEYRKFCPNAETLDFLRSSAGTQPGGTSAQLR